jgi:hypothetical protein
MILKHLSNLQLETDMPTAMGGPAKPLGQTVGGDSPGTLGGATDGSSSSARKMPLADNQEKTATEKPEKSKEMADDTDLSKGFEDFSSSSSQESVKEVKDEETKAEADKPVTDEKSEEKSDDKEEAKDEAEKPDDDILDVAKLDDKEAEKAKVEKAKSVKEKPSEHSRLFEEIFAKKMSKEAVEFVRARIKQLETLESSSKTLQEQLTGKDAEFKKLQEASKSTKLPDSYYEHPEAYKLSKDYTELSQQANEMDAAYTHYERQLISIEESKKYQQLVRDPKTGQLMVDPNLQDATPAIKAQILAHLSKLQTQFGQNVAAQEQMKNTYASARQNVTNFVDKLNTRFFPEYDGMDDKHPEYAELKRLDNAVLPEIKSMPLYPMLSRAYLKIRGLQIKLAEKQKSTAREEVDQKTRKQAVKQSDTKAVSSGSAKDKDVLFDEDVSKKFKELTASY